MRYTMTLLALILTACDNGGSDDATPDGGMPPSADDPSCVPALYDHQVTEAAADLTLTVDGEAVPLALNPAAVYPDGDLTDGLDRHAVCGSVFRSNARDGVWSDTNFSAIFEDGGAAIARIDVMGTPRGVNRPLISVQRASGRYVNGAMNEGTVTVEPSPSCGQSVTYRFEGVSGTLNPDRFGEGEPVPYTLEGTLTVAAPAVVESNLSPVEPVFGCEGEQRVFDAVTSADTDRLPFAGSCWDGGNSIRGGGSWQFDFRARPGDQPAQLAAIVPWIFRFQIGLQGLTDGSQLTITVPEGLVEGEAEAPGAREAWVAIDDNTDDIFGSDWRATGGTITVESFSTAPADNGFGELITMEAEVAIDVQSLGPCDAEPSLTGETIRITGRLRIAETDE